MSEELKSKPVRISGAMHFNGNVYRGVFSARVRLAAAREFEGIRRLEEGTAIVAEGVWAGIRNASNPRSN